MGVSVFMLIWLILYSTGLVSICFGRTNENSVELLMLGVFFFFLFSSILLVICIILFTPGIMMRQFISRPLIYGHENISSNSHENIYKIIDVLTPQLNKSFKIDSFNIHETIDECRQNKTMLNLKSFSQIMKVFLDSVMEDLVFTKKLVRSISSIDFHWYLI